MKKAKWQPPKSVDVGSFPETFGNCVGGSTAAGGISPCANGQDTGQPGCEAGANTTNHECQAGGNTTHNCITGIGVHG
jgi:hypothetical protein